MKRMPPIHWIYSRTMKPFGRFLPIPLGQLWVAEPLHNCLPAVRLWRPWQCSKCITDRVEVAVGIFTEQRQQIVGSSQILPVLFSKLNNGKCFSFSFQLCKPCSLHCSPNCVLGFTCLPLALFIFRLLPARFCICFAFELLALLF